jgi:photosystem II stability/assembly factor-like uncharacterized protein
MRCAAFTALLCVTPVATGCEDVTSHLPDGPPPEVVRITWPRVTPPVNANFYAVAGSGPDDVVIVGSGGTILRWNGTELAREESGTTEDLHAVYVMSATRAAAVGKGGTVLWWDGTSWLVSAASTVSQANLYGVWASGDDLFAVGDRGVVVATGPMIGSAGYVVVPTASPDNLYTVNHNGSELLAFGTLGTVAHFNGTSFTRTSLPGYAKTIVGSERRGSRLNLVGLDGALLTYDADGTVTRREGLPAVFLHGVGSTSAATYVAGWDGVLGSIAGGAVTIYAHVPERWLYGVYAADVEDVWVVGTSSLILHGPPREIDAGVPL